MDIVKDPAIVNAAALTATERDLRRKRTLRAAAALIGALALTFGSYWGWRTWASSSDAATRLVTATVQRGSVEDAVTATGTLQPRDYVDVGTQVSGQLKKLHVEIGTTVKAGQLLAEIDPTVYLSRVDADRAQLQNLNAQLAERKAQLVLAEQQFQRQTNLMREQAGTAEALQTAEAALASAKAQLDVLKAQIQQASSTLRGDEANLSYTKIYAPMAGTVVAQSAKQGQTLNANQQAPNVLRIADLSTMTIQSQVSEADVSRLKTGMDVYFTTLGNPGKRWYAKLRQINPTPETVNNVVLYNALFDVENPDGALMTQMTAQIFFVVAQARDVIVVPLSALASTGGADGTKGGQRRQAAADGAVRARAGAAGTSAESASGARDDKAGSARNGAGSARTANAGSVDARARIRGGQAHVRVVKPDGTIEVRDVKVGVTNRVSAEIVAGLEAGEQVVIGQRTAQTEARAAPAPSATSMMPRGRL
jgi:macrolide-specific efflux system membrane fusion protein